MENKIYSILEGLSNIQINEQSFLLQQNKNVCMKILSEFKKVLPTYEGITGNTYAYLTREYYSLSLIIDYRISIRNLSWEEYNSKLYLMAEPYIQFVNYKSFTGLHQNNLFEILKEYILGDSIRYLDEENIISDTGYELNIIRKELSHNLKGTFESVLLPNVQKAVDNVMSSKYSYNIHSKLHPEVKNRNKVPLLIFDVEESVINFIGRYYSNKEIDISLSKNAVKISVNSSSSAFLPHCNYYVKTILDKLPLLRWVNFTIPKSKIILYDIFV